MKYTVAQSRRSSMNPISINRSQGGLYWSCNEVLRAFQRSRSLSQDAFGSEGLALAGYLQHGKDTFAFWQEPQVLQLEAPARTWHAGCMYRCLSFFSCCHSCCTRRLMSCTTSAPCLLCRRAAASCECACSGPRDAGSTCQMHQPPGQPHFTCLKGAWIPLLWLPLPTQTVLAGRRTERCADRLPAGSMEVWLCSTWLSVRSHGLEVHSLL